MITQLLEQSNGFLALSEDGSVSFYAPVNEFEQRHVLKYITFELKDQIGLGLDRSDQ